MKNLTNIQFKSEKPRTVVEKYDRLKVINLAIEVLKNTFDLELSL